MKPLMNELFIISAEIATEGTIRNHERDYEMYDLLRNIPSMRANGNYNGRDENSHIVFDESVARSMCADFNQECYLKRHMDGSCYLVYADGNTEYIGQWAEIPSKPTRSPYSEVAGRYFKTVLLTS